MSDFDAMTYFEINKAVAESIGVNATVCTVDHGYIDGEISKDTFLTDNNGPVIDYCNNWGDGGPIIVENNISLHKYKSQHGYQAYDIADSVYADDINPLRAAMIVYLKMKEAESE